MTTETDNNELEIPDPLAGRTLEEMQASEAWYRQQRKERYNLEVNPFTMSPEEIQHWEKVQKEKNQELLKINNYLEKLYQVTGARVERQLNLTIEDAKLVMGEIMKAHGFTRKNYITEGTNIPEVLNLFIKWGLYHGDTTLDLQKGIYLYGRVGSSKTTLLQFLSQFTIATGFRTFHVAHVKEIMVEISIAGNLSPLKKYLTGTWCFNDIGFEDQDKNYGSRIDLIERLFSIRADKKLLTLATGNIYPKFLLEVYGDRIESRFHEMFNMIELKNKLDFRTMKPPAQ